MMSCLLGIDIGTSSIKVAQYDEMLKTISLVSKSYKIIHKETGYSSVEMSTLWDSFLFCLRKMKEQGVRLEKIKGIGISAMCPGLVAIGDKREFLSEVILYSDRRSQSQAKWIKEKIGDSEIFRITANNMMAGAISCTSMLWIKENYPEIYQKTRWFGHLNTAFSVLLTGEAAIDRSNASYTGLFSTSGDLQWSGSLCAKIGISAERLPKILDSHECCGYLDAEEVIALGIPTKTPVVIGAADTPCASIACGLTQVGRVCESVGTTDVLTACINQPVFGREFINRCHAVKGLWIYQGAMSNTGPSMDWCLETLCGDLIEKAKGTSLNPKELMSKEAANSCAGANGVVFLPYLEGERSPVWDPNARGVFFGIQRRTQRHDLIRAVLESSGYGMRQLLGIYEELTGFSCDSIDIVGGGAKNLFWSQLRANILGKTVRILENNNASVLGAAMLAGVGVGLFRSIEDANSILGHPVWHILEPNATEECIRRYDLGYRVYLDLYKNLRMVFAL